METKFTKGNWELHEGRIKCNGKLIITCWYTKKIDEEPLEGESWLDFRERTKEDRKIHYEIEPQANAKLVSAAPDMYESLLRLVEEVQNLIEFTSEQGFINWEDETLTGVINMKSAKKMAIEALKKATE
jgi:hypothetical protein